MTTGTRITATTSVLVTLYTMYWTILGRYQSEIRILTRQTMSALIRATYQTRLSMPKTTNYQLHSGKWIHHPISIRIKWVTLWKLIWSWITTLSSPMSHSKVQTIHSHSTSSLKSRALWTKRSNTFFKRKLTSWVNSKRKVYGLSLEYLCSSLR